MGAFDQRQHAYNAVKGAYTTELGREGSDEEIWSHLSGGRDIAQKNIDWALGQTHGSQEAETYRNRPQAVRETPSDKNTNMIGPPQVTPPITTGGDDRRGPIGGEPAAPPPQFQSAAPAMAAPAAPAQPAITNQITDLLK